MIQFEQNWGEIWTKMIRFEQIWLDLGKIKIVHPQKHSISYGDGSKQPSRDNYRKTP